MNIEIKKEDKPAHPYEHCVFCDVPTTWWNLKTNRPVCKVCSKLYKQEDIKTAPFNYE